MVTKTFVHRQRTQYLPSVEFMQTERVKLTRSTYLLYQMDTLDVNINRSWDSDFSVLYDCDLVYLYRIPPCFPFVFVISYKHKEETFSNRIGFSGPSK